MKSIIQTERECYVCGTTQDIHEHHIFEGTANRRQSEKYGMKIFLCGRHHNMSNEGVHFKKELDLKLKQQCQKAWEYQIGTREQFIMLFGRNYL